MSEKRPIKVLRIIARLNVGGPALHCVLLSENLDKHGFETALITGTPSNNEADFEKVYNLQPQNFRLIKLNRMKRMVSGLGDLMSLIELIRILRKEKPDVVHTHTAKAGTLGRIAAFVTGTPVVVHTFHGHVLSGYFSPFFSKLVCYIERALALKTTAIVTLSEGLKTELSGKFKLAPLSKFKVIPLGRDLDQFFQNGIHRGKLKEELKLPAESVLIGIVGRLVPIKNHALLLQAVSKLPKELPWHLAVVGEGEEMTALVSLTKDLGLEDKVHFMGWRTDLDYLYAGLDIFVLSSNNEGTPLSIIESFASGVPVVSTNVGGVKDMFTQLDSEKSNSEVSVYAEGMLVPPQNTSALTKALLLFIQEERLRNTAGLKARLRARDFSQENLTMRIAGLYKELLEVHA